MDDWRPMSRSDPPQNPAAAPPLAELLRRAQELAQRRKARQGHAPTDPQGRWMRRNHYVWDKKKG